MPYVQDLHPHDLSATFFPPRTILNEIRERITEKLREEKAKSAKGKSKDKRIKLVYITREDAAVRRITVEEERNLLLHLMEVVGTF